MRAQAAAVRQQYAEAFPEHAAQAAQGEQASGCAPEPWLEASFGDDWLGASCR